MSLVTHIGSNLLIKILLQRHTNDGNARLLFLSISKTTCMLSSLDFLNAIRLGPIPLNNFSDTIVDKDITRIETLVSNGDLADNQAASSLVEIDVEESLDFLFGQLRLHPLKW
jgi:hypothetical protein